MAFAMEFRKVVAKAYDECGSSIEVAEQFNCSESRVQRLIRRRRETGSLATRTMRMNDDLAVAQPRSGISITVINNPNRST